MATRSRIGIELQDGSVLSSYHHWDGYPEWLGKTLVEHYNTREKAAELIDGGDMSSCWADEIWGTKLPEGQYAPEYYTERGESIEANAPHLDQSLAEYLEDGEEFAYLYTSAGWVCYDRHEFSDDAPEVVAIPAV